jgi:hypothetical protein
VIPSRGLIATANEADLGADALARSHVMLYALGEGPASYPAITSEGAAELIGWGALSGLAADPAAPGALYAISDSVYGMQPRIFTVDATQTPARSPARSRSRATASLRRSSTSRGSRPTAEGGFWLASEGAAIGSSPTRCIM